MSVIIKVLVKMPDGTSQYLPLVRPTGELVTQPSRKEARNWVEFVLPSKVSLSEEDNDPVSNGK